MGFIVKLLLILAVVAGGIWAWMMFAPKTNPSQTQTSTTETAQTTQAPKDISVSGSSDAALQGDLKLLDTQVDAASTESASADSFSDQPIDQAE